MIPRGLGRSYGDAAQNGGGDVIRCTRLDRVLDLDVAKGTCTVESGVSIEMLMRVFLPLGWFPMVVPGTRYVTVGGAIASDIHGKFRHGSFADSVERMQLLTPERGVLTVGPDDDADVFWATAGGMGLTGIVTEATLQLQPVETAHMVVDTERAVDLDDCMARMLDRDREYRYSVAWIDCLAGGAHLGRSVLTRGNHAALDDLPDAKRPRAREFAPRTRSAHTAVDSQRAAQSRSRSARSTRSGSVRLHASAGTRCRPSPPSSIRSTPCSTGTGSTDRTASCSTSSSSRTARKPSCAPCSSDCRRTGARRSSRS